MDDSFLRTLIELESRGRTRSKAANRTLDNKQGRGEEPIQLSPGAIGKIIHQKFKKQIKQDTRDGIEGEMLKAMEYEFNCEFIQAEVSISGFARKTEQQVDFWSGKMDAVAIRRSKKDVLEVFVVEWKTTATKIPRLSNICDWWYYASHFKEPLYQCLVYRKLLLAHLKRYNVKALVGIILVPFLQMDLERSCPGLCLNFERMVEEHLLDELNKFQWLAVLNDPINVHTIKLPRKLFGESFDPAVDVDRSTNVLKGDTRLKDILNENATVADLRQALDLPFLKVEGIKEEEKKAKKDDKTSRISSSQRGAQDATSIPLKLPKIKMQ